MEELLSLYKELMRKGLRRPAGRENVEILLRWLSEGFRVTQVHVLIQARHAAWVFLIGSFPDERERATAFPILPDCEGLLESICERFQPRIVLITVMRETDVESSRVRDLTI